MILPYSDHVVTMRMRIIQAEAQLAAMQAALARSGGRGRGRRRGRGYIDYN